jgi:zinc protease
MPQQVVSLEGITEYRLDNGFRVLLYPDPSSAKVTVNLTVLVGSRHEGYGETGMAHLLEHMLFKGTPTFPDVPKALRDRGAQFNGTTWVDRTNYYETMEASDANLEFAIRLEADRLVNSFVRGDDLASEMTVVRNEFEAGENNPQTILFQRLLAAAYSFHNYGKPTIGNRSDIERVPIDRLQAFYRKYYQPDNALLIVAGNFDEAKALTLADRYFGTLLKPTRVLEPTYTEEPPQDGERSVVLRRVGTLGVVAAVYHTPAGSHPDYPAVEVLGTLLGAKPSGPLYKGLVVTKMASDIGSAAFSWYDPGVLYAIAQADKDQDLLALREALLRSLETAADGIVVEEVERAKGQLAKRRELAMKDANRVGVTLSDWASKGDWRLFFLHRDRVASVQADDVARVARQYLQPTNRTVGVFIPAEQTRRTPIPPVPDLATVLEGYTGNGSAVAQGEFFDPTPANIEQRTQRGELPSGMKLALLPKKTRGAAVVLEMTLRCGNAASLVRNTSATTLLPFLLVRGTRKYTRQQMEDELDRLHVRLSPSGVLGEVSYTVECKRETLAPVLALLEEILRRPTFPAEEFDVLKRQTRDSLERARTDPQALAGRALQRKLNPFAPDHIRYVPTVEESLARLEATTLEQVKRLYEEQVGSSAGEVVIVGDFDRDQTAGLRVLLGNWRAPMPYQRVERPAIAGIAGETVRIEVPDKANAVYSAGLAFALMDTDPDYAALVVGNFLFGGSSLTSRLGNRVRQKEGLSYGVGSQFNASGLDPAARFAISAIFNPATVDKLTSVITEELARLLEEGVHEQELGEAKEAYLKQMKIRRAGDEPLAALLQEGLYEGKTLAFYAELETRIAGLTVEQVNAALRRHLDPTRLVVVQAGDFRRAESPGHSA